MSQKKLISTVIFLFLVAAFSSAQTYSILYNFTGGKDGNLPFGGLIEDSSGNLYGTTTGGGTGSGQLGSVFKLTKTGKITVLHHFGTSNPDGKWPFARVARDSHGSLYGTTAEGGASGQGTVFKITRSGVFSILHSFSSGSGSADGWGPTGPVIFDSAGNLYGATPNGGDPACNGGFGCGVAFELDAAGNETVLRAFIDGKKGDNPTGGLVRDADGNLYGTNAGGGYRAGGTVYKLDPSGNETVLYTFQGAADGKIPSPGLLRDSIGNLYGTTTTGGILANGKKGYGVIFKLDINGNFSTLYTFTGTTDGIYPNGNLIMDSAGNLYGTTQINGSCKDYLCGTVFKLDSTGNFTLLHTFTYGDTQGYGPRDGLLLDSLGNLYGTASFGGNPSYCIPNGGCGVVFKIAP